MKTFAIPIFVVALAGAMVTLSAAPADAGSDKKKGSSATTSTGGTATSGTTKGVSGLDLGSGR
jgi:hypothetical protein